MAIAINPYHPEKHFPCRYGGEGAFFVYEKRDWRVANPSKETEIRA